MQPALDVSFTKVALRMALSGRAPVEEGRLDHSDCGSLYAAPEHQESLARHHIVPSMSRRGNCDDTAVVESSGKHFVPTKTGQVQRRSVRLLPARNCTDPISSRRFSTKHPSTFW
jgi:transposase InsO family protein